MVMPMPAISITPIPTDYALKMRNIFWAFSCIMVICSFLQMFVFLNIIGGFMMLIIAGIGFYSIRDHSVDMNCLMTWGMICLVNGVFDTVFLIDRAVKMQQPLFSLHVPHPFLYNLIHAMIILGPIAELSASFTVYRVYKEATELDAEPGAWQQPAGRAAAPAGAPPTDYGSGQVGSGAITAGADGLSRSNPGQVGGGSAFTPFGGKGNTLGAEDQ